MLNITVSSTLTAKVLFNGQGTDESVTWRGNEYVNVDQSGNYTLTGEVGDVAQIVASFGVVEEFVDIAIVSNADPNKNIVITPLIAELKERESAEFDVFLYINGVKQSNIPTYRVSGINNNYILKQDGNTFTLTNVKATTKPLEITFVIGEMERTIFVRLKALF